MYRLEPRLARGSDSGSNRSIRIDCGDRPPLVRPGQPVAMLLGYANEHGDHRGSDSIQVVQTGYGLAHPIRQQSEQAAFAAGRRHAVMPISSREMKCQCAASTGVMERRLPRRSSSIPANCG